jgi:uncharacterized protein
MGIIPTAEWGFPYCCRGGELIVDWLRILTKHVIIHGMERLQQSIEAEVVRRLVEEFHPEAVYLFGSHAWGEPQEGSDIDLLVILSESQQTPARRAARAHRSLRGLQVPVDVLVKTRAEFERYLPVYASLEAQIVEKGKLLYGSETRAG